MKIINGLSGFSKEFKIFYENFIIDPRSLMRGELDLNFLNSLDKNEKIIVLDYLRGELKKSEKKVYVIEALGVMKDQQSLTTLNNLFLNESRLRWRISLSQALYRIGKSDSFFAVLEELVKKGNIKDLKFYQHLFLNFEKERCLSILTELLIKLPDSERHYTLTLLNYVITGKQFSIMEKQLPYGEDFFTSRFL